MKTLLTYDIELWKKNVTKTEKANNLRVEQMQKTIHEYEDKMKDILMEQNQL